VPDGGRRRTVRVDLGCGATKQAEFVGIDRYALPEVDMVADLNQPLPLRDHCADLVYAGHSLEHVSDLQSLMKEIYRVCKHGAQVCIVAPYYQQGLNLANPYHKQVFNEHTPRFWTNAQTTVIPLDEFAHPHAPVWGLSESDSSRPGIDLRCLKLEFFYFSEYRDLSSEEQRAARKKYLDVCDQIMFHLLVIKEPMSDAEVQSMAEKVECYEPQFVTIRKLQEQGDRDKRAIEELRQMLATQGTEFARTQGSLAEAQAENARREQVAEELRRALATQAAELSRTQGSLAEAQAENARREQVAEELRRALATQAAEFARTQGSLAEAQADNVRREEAAQELRQELATQAAELGNVRAASIESQKQLAILRDKGRMMATELDLFRRRKAIRWLARLKRPRDLANDVHPAFQQLKDDSFLFTPDLKGFRLEASCDLQLVPFLAYPLKLGRPRLGGVLLAPIFDFPISQGMLGVELVSPSNTIVAQSDVPFTQIEDGVPTRFLFPAVPNSDQGHFWLRVFVRGTTEPVRIFEWRQYGLAGLGRLRSRAFGGFIFQ